MSKLRSDCLDLEEYKGRDSRTAAQVLQRFDTLPSKKKALDGPGVARSRDNPLLQTTSAKGWWMSRPSQQDVLECLV